MKNNKKNKKYVVWAIDANDKKTRPNSKAVENLRNLIKGASATLLPVQVLPPSDQEAGIVDNFNLAKRSIEIFVENYNFFKTVKTQVVVSDADSRSSMVQCLLNYAQEKRADLIALSTHGRSTLGRVMFGSFAENVLQKSPYPVFFLGRNVKTVRRVNARPVALFPTDFAEHSHLAFRKFLKQAKKLNIEVALLHFASLPVLHDGVYVQSAAFTSKYLAEQIRSAKNKAKIWLKEAEKEGVKARFILKDGWVGLLTGDILLKFATQAKVDFIVMASKSAPINRLWLGSVAYDILRAGKIPVWIYGPKTLEKKKPAARAKNRKTRGPRGVI